MPLENDTFPIKLYRPAALPEGIHAKYSFGPSGRAGAGIVGENPEDAAQALAAKFREITQTPERPVKITVSTIELSERPIDLPCSLEEVTEVRRLLQGILPDIDVT